MKAIRRDELREDVLFGEPIGGAGSGVDDGIDDVLQRDSVVVDGPGIGGDGLRGNAQGFFEPLLEFRKPVVANEVFLVRFREVAEIEGACCDEVEPVLFLFVVRENSIVGLEGRRELAEVVFFEEVEIKSNEVDRDVFVERSKRRIGEITGDFREITTDERLAQESGFKEGETEAFGDGGSDKMGGMAEPTGE